MVIVGSSLCYNWFSVMQCCSAAGRVDRDRGTDKSGARAELRSTTRTRDWRMEIWSRLRGSRSCWPEDNHQSHTFHTNIMTAREEVFRWDKWSSASSRGSFSKANSANVGNKQLLVWPFGGLCHLLSRYFGTLNNIISSKPTKILLFATIQIANIWSI